MKRGKHYSQYEAEINDLMKEHSEALLAIYADACRDGMKIGGRNTLTGSLIGVTVALIGLCIGGIMYHEHKEQ